MPHTPAFGAQCPRTRGTYTEYHIVGQTCCTCLLTSFFLPSHLSFKYMYRTTNNSVHTTCTPWWDMSVHENMYNKSPPSGKARTLASLHRNCCLSKLEKHIGSRHPPLLELEPSSYVMDELHLFLQLADILVCNLIHLADREMAALGPTYTPCRTW